MENYKLPTLYGKPSKGDKIKVWDICIVTDSDVPTIKRSFGYQDGKMQEIHKPVPKGKNIGKANETTPLEQAISEMKSLWTKQKSAGLYVENIKDFVTEKVPQPMLAHDYNKKNNQKYIKDVCFVQPKLDGVRMLVSHDGNMYSRNGKSMTTLDNIRNEILGLKLPAGTYLDGELFTFDLPFAHSVACSYAFC